MYFEPSNGAQHVFIVWPPGRQLGVCGIKIFEFRDTVIMIITQ
jgi:hypothetical protein